MFKSKNGSLRKSLMYVLGQVMGQVIFVKTLGVLQVCRVNNFRNISTKSLMYVLGQVIYTLVKCRYDC